MVNLNDILHGPNSKLYLAGGAVAAAVIFFEYRKANSGVAASTAPVDPTGGADYTDPGYDSYGSDTAGMFGYVDHSTGATITGGSGQPQVITAPTNNTQWSQQVQAMLIQQGYQSTAVAAALGHYIVGTEMSPAQYEIVLAGIALEGKPPQPVPPVRLTHAPAPPPKNYDGWYVRNPDRTHWQVQNNVLYHVLWTTASKIKPQPAWKPVLGNNPIFALKRGKNL